MATALAIVPQAAPVVPSFDMNDMERIATAIAKGGMFGSKDPYAVLTLCMVAQAEGQHPAVVFRDYHLISGKPSKKAEAMQRDFLAAGGRIEWHELTDDCCSATFSHPSGGSAKIDWDKARVKQAQLGSNAMHAKYPRQMLRARVISEGVRTVFPGATSGMYVPEEVSDFDNAKPATPIMPQPQRARQIERQPQPEQHDPETGELVTDADEKRASAEGWVSRTLLAIGNAADTEALAKVQSPARINALADLRAAFPDLAQQVDAAIVARLGQLETEGAEA